MIELIQNNLTTVITCLVIVIFAIYYFRKIWIINYKFNNNWGKSKFAESIKNIESDKYLAELHSEYKSTIIFEGENSELKTDIKADEIINISTVLKKMNINYRAMSSASAILVGLGLFGTFLGLTLGISKFDSSSTESIQGSINALLGGMGTAFFTSLFGMGFSTIYIVSEKYLLNIFSRRIDDICLYLDRENIISQPEKYALIYRRMNQQLISLFTTTNTNGETLTPGNLLRDTYEENQKQTRALSGFTEDLFYEIANKAMNESLIPLVAEVKNVTDTLSIKLEDFANIVKDPGENMADNIVKELKESITTLLTELQHTVSSIAGDKIDGLNSELQSATVALASFPDKMETMMGSLSDHFTNINHLVDKLVKDASKLNDGNVNQMQTQMENVSGMLSTTTKQIEQLITDMSTKSLDTNSSIINQMQEQVNYSTTNMNNLTNTIGELMTKLNKQTEDASSNILRSQEQIQERSNKTLEDFTSNLSNIMQGVISNLNNQSEEANNNMILNQGIMQEQTEEANKTLLNQIQEQVNYSTVNMTSLTSVIQETVTNLNKQSEEIGKNMMLSQEQNQTISDKALASLSVTVSSLEELVNGIKNTITQFVNLQQETNQTASNMSELSRNAVVSTVNLREAQTAFIDEIKDNSKKSLESIQGLEVALIEAKDLPQEYVQKFGVIRDALSIIFESINNGLKQYNITVKNSTSEILDTYSSSMTNAIGKLSVAISDLGDVVDDISSVKRKY